jgi:hypothetical protein
LTASDISTRGGTRTLMTLAPLDCGDLSPLSFLATENRAAPVSESGCMLPSASRTCARTNQRGLIPSASPLSVPIPRHHHNDLPSLCTQPAELYLSPFLVHGSPRVYAHRADAPAFTRREVHLHPTCASALLPRCPRVYAAGASPSPYGSRVRAVGGARFPLVVYLKQVRCLWSDNGWSLHCASSGDGLFVGRCLPVRSVASRP